MGSKRNKKTAKHTEPGLRGSWRLAQKSAGLPSDWLQISRLISPPFFAPLETPDDGDPHMSFS
jgi:hypothetical protein